MSVPFGVFASSVEEGLGVASGGATGEVLAKASDLNFDTEWVASQPASFAAAATISSAAYFDGVTGLVKPTRSNDLVSANDSAALSITGDIDIQIKVTLNDWTIGDGNSLISKWVAAGTRSFGFGQMGTNLRFAYSTDGTNGAQVSSDAHGITSGTKWLRYTLDADDGGGNRVSKFYLSDDGAAWTQLGATITTAGAISIFDSTAPMSLAGGGQFIAGILPMGGTLHRVIIRNGYDGAGSVAFDANFETVTADALAFTESSTNAATVSLVSTRYTYGLPNTEWSAVAAIVLTGNRVYYQPFLVTAPTVVDMTAFRITSGPNSPANVRTGIYAADANMQPTGAPVLDSGDVAVGTSATGNFYTSVTPVTLQPGMYLTAINGSLNMTYQLVRGGMATADIGKGANAILTNRFGAQTQGVFPNPGTPWDIATFSGTGPNHALFLRWRPA